MNEFFNYLPLRFACLSGQLHSVITIIEIKHNKNLQKSNDKSVIDKHYEQLELSIRQGHTHIKEFLEQLIRMELKNLRNSKESEKNIIK